MSDKVEVYSNGDLHYTLTMRIFVPVSLSLVGSPLINPFKKRFTHLAVLIHHVKCNWSKVSLLPANLNMATKRGTTVTNFKLFFILLHALTIIVNYSASTLPGSHNSLKIKSECRRFLSHGILAEKYYNAPTCGQYASNNGTPISISVVALLLQTSDLGSRLLNR